MNRRQFLKRTLAGLTTTSLLSLSCAGNAQLTPSRTKAQEPNIVLILADDLGYGDIGCYNPDSKIPTPHIDRLAAQGIRLTDAHSPSAVCTPTRYSLLTGRYCWRSRLKKEVLTGFDPALIEPGRMTIPSLLKDHGYTTACIGKWHLGFGNDTPTDYTKPLNPGPLEVGFDHFFGIPSSLDSWPRCYIRNHHVIGRLKGPRKNQWYGKEGQYTDNWDVVQCGPVLTREAVDFINQHAAQNKGRPFFLYYASQAPHRPCRPPAFIRGTTQAGPRGDMCAEVDWTVGQILETLERNKLTDNTLVIFTSDNGAIPGSQMGAANQARRWELYDHKSCGNWRGYKTGIWDGGHRVPFIARWPRRIEPGSASPQPVCLTDTLATVAAIVEFTLPRDAAEDSFSILPVLEGRSTDGPIHEALIHHSMLGMFAVRQGPWKLILGTGSGGEKDREHVGSQAKPIPGDPPGQLYNLAADPAEQTNLYSDRPDIVKRLSAILERYQTQDRSRRI